MRREFQTILGLFIAAVLAGCAGKNPKQIKLEDSDQFKIDLAVYGFLLNGHFAEIGNYSAIFLQGDDAQVEAAAKRFPHNVPPIKPSYRADVQPNRSPLDKDTGKPAIIFSVDIVDTTNDVCEAICRWYAGPAVTGLYSFELKKTGGEWVIEIVR